MLSTKNLFRIIAFITLILGLNVKGQASDIEVLKHSINKGKLHKGGSLEIKITERTDTEIKVDIKYDLKKKSFYPIPSKVLKGSTDINLPKEFATEEGYLKLKEQGQIKVKKATVKFLKHVNYQDLYDCYQFQVIPHNGEWVGKFLYHPDVASVGWVIADITITDIPVIGSYRMTSQMQ